MIVKNFSGYRESADLTKIPVRNLVYPSKNVLVTKGKIITRGGLENDGVEKTVSEAIHSEFVWNDALGGTRPIRVHGNTVEVKYNSKWYTIFTGLDSSTIRVFFATWVDANGSIIKKRLFFADGSSNYYQWNGAIGVVESATSNSVTFATADGTGLQHGFDVGDVTAQKILHYIGSAIVSNSEESQTNDPTAQVLSISGTFDTTPVADDVIIAKPVTFAFGSDVDVFVPYANHVLAANYNSVAIYWSNASTYSLSSGLDFTMPASGSRTAITAILQTLDANFTAAVTRGGVLWISDIDDWYKTTKSVEQNAYGLWIDVEKFETGEHKGALPMAVARYKGDAIYMAQDSSLQRITSIEITGQDEIRIISDEVESLFTRLDLSDVRIYYTDRAIYIISPNDSILIILDMVEKYYQAPQTIPISCMSIIDGDKYGHHNAENSTYKLFATKRDLGTPIESVIAFPLYKGKHSFRYKTHDIFGVDCRISPPTKVNIDKEFEEEGSKQVLPMLIDGAKVKVYGQDDDASWGANPYANRSWAGVDTSISELKRVFAFDKDIIDGYFNFRPVFTISGKDNEFQLLAWWINDRPSKRKIGNDLFIAK